MVSDWGISPKLALIMNRQSLPLFRTLTRNNYPSVLPDIRNKLKVNFILGEISECWKTN